MAVKLQQFVNPTFDRVNIGNKNGTFINDGVIITLHTESLKIAEEKIIVIKSVNFLKTDFFVTQSMLSR